MKFRSDNSLHERLNRVVSGRDESQWLTEGRPQLPQRLGDQLTQEPTPVEGIPNVGNQGPDPEKLSPAIKNIADIYNNEAITARDGIDFGNIDISTPDMQQRLRDFAGNSILHARELVRNGDVRGEGAGSKAFSYNQIQALKLNEARNRALYKEEDPNKRRAIVGSTRPFQWTPKFVESTFQLVKQLVKSSGPLSGKYQKAKNPADQGRQKRGLHAGQIGVDNLPLTKNEEGLYEFEGPPPQEFNRNGTEKSASIKRRRAYFDKLKKLDDEQIGQVINAFGATSSNRARLMWRLWLEQGGLEGLTQLPLNLLDAELEHTVPFQMEGEDIPQPKDPKNPTEEEWEAMYEHVLKRDHIDNFMLISKALNNSKSNLDMDGLYDRRVRPLYDITKDDFDVADRETEAINTKTNDFIGQLLPFLFDGKGNVRDNANIEEFFTKIAGFNDTVAEHQKNVQDLYPQVRSSSALLSGLDLVRGATDTLKLPELLSKGTGFDSMSPEQETYRDDYFGRIQQLTDYLENTNIEELLQDLPRRKTKAGREDSDEKHERRKMGILDQIETLKERLAEYGITNDNYQRSQWAGSRAAGLSFENSKTRILKRVLENLGLSHTWSRKGTEKSPGDRGGISSVGSKKGNDAIEGFLKSMLTPENLGDPEKLKAFKKMWRLAYKRAVETDDTGIDAFGETLSQLANNPANLPADIDELLSTLTYPNKEPRQTNYESVGWLTENY